MSYGFRICKINREDLKKVMSCNDMNEVATLGIFESYEEDDGKRYTPVYDICTQLHDMGDIDLDFESLGSCQQITPYRDTDDTAVMFFNDALAFENVIEFYRQKVVNYYKSLLMTPEEVEKERGYVLNYKSPEEKCKDDIKDKIFEWSNEVINPYNLNTKCDSIVYSWKYEYAVFELVRIYKTFDFENDAFIIIGW